MRQLKTQNFYSKVSNSGKFKVLEINNSTIYDQVISLPFIIVACRKKINL